MEHLDFPGLTPVQVQVALSLASGASFSTAAQSAGVARCTLYRWLDDSPALAAAVQKARSEYVLTLRDQLRDASRKSLDALTAILNDPQAPASVRLKAALAVLNRPHFPDPGWHLPEKMATPPAQHHQHDNAPEAAATESDISEHNSANVPDPQAPNEPNETNSDTFEHKNALFPPMPARSTKTSRNEPCPCGSGRKFKHCCLNKTAPDIPSGQARAA